MNKVDEKVQKLENKITFSALPKIILTEVLTADQYLGLPKALRQANLSEEHLLRLYAMRSYGISVLEISEKLGYPKLVIDKILSSLEYRAIVDMIGQDVVSSARDVLLHATEKATTTLVGLLDSDDERIQLKASSEILNRTGIDAVRKVEVSTKSEHIHKLPKEQLDYILKAANLANELAGKIEITDTVFEEVGEDESTES